MVAFMNEKERKNTMLGLRIVGDFGASIAIPVVVFVLIGQWLDEKYQKSPLFTILAFVLAAIITGKIIYKKAKGYGNEYKKIDDSEKKS